jgi:predicted nuclease of restriction endonuclease-like (RecB) superfamily
MIDNLTPDTPLYNEIADLLHLARKKATASINLAMVRTYFEIGRRIVEHEQHGQERAAYGKHTLKDLSARLTAQFGRGFSERNLEQMRSFFLIYSIPQTLSAELSKSPNFVLSWSHYLFLMRIDNLNERQFYEIETANNQWSLRELQRQFNSALYERLALSRDKTAVKKLAEQGEIVTTPQDAVRDPYILEFLGLDENTAYSESDLEKRIINQLQAFLLELGKGFAFIGRQERFTFDDKHFRVDLVFYNRFLHCFVLLDLKIGEVLHQDLGQMQMYVNYYDRFVKTDDENQTIGIILCKKKNDTLVEITLPKDNTQIFASKYQTFLPDKADLKALLEQAEE